MSSGRTAETGDQSGNDRSGNDRSGNDRSGNDRSGNDRSAETRVAEPMFQLSLFRRATACHPPSRTRSARCLAVSSLFASVLGVNPVQHLLAADGALSWLPVASQRILTGREFFPHLISGPFHHGLVIVFAASAVLAALAGLASLLRGARPRASDRRVG